MTNKVKRQEVAVISSKASLQEFSVPNSVGSGPSLDLNVTIMSSP